MYTCHTRHMLQGWGRKRRRTEFTTRPHAFFTSTFTFSRFTQAQGRKFLVVRGERWGSGGGCERRRRRREDGGIRGWWWWQGEQAEQEGRREGGVCVCVKCGVGWVRGRHVGKGSGARHGKAKGTGIEDQGIREEMRGDEGDEVGKGDEERRGSQPTVPVAHLFSPILFLPLKSKDRGKEGSRELTPKRGERERKQRGIGWWWLIDRGDLFGRGIHAQNERSETFKNAKTFTQIWNETKTKICCLVLESLYTCSTF